MDESVINGIFWNHLVYPELASDEVEDPSIVGAWIHERLPDGQWPAYVVCVAIDELDTAESAKRRTAVQQARAVIGRTLPPSQRALLGFAHTNALYFCGALEGNQSGLLVRLGVLNAALSAELGLSCTMGVAFLREESFAGLQWAAQFAIVAQRQKVRTGSGRVYVYDPSTPPTTLDLGAYWRLAQKMHAVIRSGDMEATQAALDQITHALFHEAYLSLNHLRPLLQSQVIFMAQAASDAVVDAAAVARQSEAFLSQIGTAYDYARLREVLADAALAFAQLVHDRFAGLSNRLVAAVDEYIAANLADQDLSLHQIAMHLGVSPAHLSRTYKKVRGAGITRSINEQRVEFAKRGLLNRQASITTVAFDAGFGSLQHFGRVFKEVTGRTPTAYRAHPSSPGE